MWLCLQKKSGHKLTLKITKKPTTKTVTKKKKKQKALANKLQILKEIDLETSDALPHTQKYDAHIKKVCKSFVTVLFSYVMDTNGRTS